MHKLCPRCKTRTEADTHTCIHCGHRYRSVRNSTPSSGRIPLFWGLALLIGLGVWRLGSALPPQTGNSKPQRIRYYESLIKQGKELPVTNPKPEEITVKDWMTLQQIASQVREARLANRIANLEGQLQKMSDTQSKQAQILQTKINQSQEQMTTIQTRIEHWNSRAETAMERTSEH